MTITFSKLAIIQGDPSDIDAIHPIVPSSKDIRDSFVPKPGIELEALSALSGILSRAPDISRLVHRCSSSYTMWECMYECILHIMKCKNNSVRSY